jgi:hypothetical protein
MSEFASPTKASDKRIETYFGGAVDCGCGRFLLAALEVSAFAKD